MRIINNNYPLKTLVHIYIYLGTLVLGLFFTDWNRAKTATYHPPNNLHMKRTLTTHNLSLPNNYLLLLSTRKPLKHFYTYFRLWIFNIRFNMLFSKIWTNCFNNILNNVTKVYCLFIYFCENGILYINKIFKELKVLVRVQ